MVDKHKEHDIVEHGDGNRHIILAQRHEGTKISFLFHLQMQKNHLIFLLLS